MAEDILVGDTISESITLLDYMDRQGLCVWAMVLLLYEDTDEWKILVSADAFEKKFSHPNGKFEQYHQMAEILQASKVRIDLTSIKIVKRDDPVILGLSMFRVEGGIAEIHKSYFGGIYIKSAKILRLDTQMQPKP